MSLGTASNVFNRPALVRAEMRAHVERVAAELGFSGPDAAGRLLMGGKANAIGFVPAGDMPVAFIFGSPYLSALVLGIAEVCDANGASLMVVSSAEERKAWAIRNALVDGFILGHPDEIAMVAIRRRPVPFVLMDTAGGPGQSSVVIDGRGGARLAAEHLLALGHRRFAIVATQRAPRPPIWHPPGSGPRRLAGGFALDEEKLAGYGDALAAAGIALDNVPIIEIYPPSPWAGQGAALLLDKAPDVTAVLAMADRTAEAVMVEAARRGIAVPGQLSVVGFDDVPSARLTSPPLTTIRQDIVEKGRIGAGLLFAGGAASQVQMPVELVPRGSTAAPGG